MDQPIEAICVMCKKNVTTDRYELDDYEMDTMVHEIGVKKASTIQNKEGSVPICDVCFEKTGFTSEIEDELPPLIQLKPSEFKV